MPQKSLIDREMEANCNQLEKSAVETATRAALNVVKAVMFACFGVAALIAANAI